MQHQGSIPLETERLYLRRFCREDAEAMYRNWTADPEVTRYLTWKPHRSLKVTQDVLDTWCRHETQTTYRWAITQKREAFADAEPNEPVGQIDVVKTDAEGWGMMGWVLSRRCWGRGIMTEAARAVFRYLLETVGFSGLYASCDVDNEASGAVMRRMGMRLCGKNLEGYCNPQGILRPVWEYRLSREEFETLTLRPAQAGDLAEIARVYAEVCDAQPAAPDKAGSPGWKREVYPTAVTAREAWKRGELHVAVQAGRIVGTVILNEEQPPAYRKAVWHFPADRAYVVHTLAVRPGARGRGVGEAIMRYAEQQAAVRELPVLRLDTYALNFPARRLYERMGFLPGEIVDLGIWDEFGMDRFQTYEKQVSAEVPEDAPEAPLAETKAF